MSDKNKIHLERNVWSWLYTFWYVYQTFLQKIVSQYSASWKGVNSSLMYTEYIYYVSSKPSYVYNTLQLPTDDPVKWLMAASTAVCSVFVIYASCVCDMLCYFGFWLGYAPGLCVLFLQGLFPSSQGRLLNR